MTATTATAITSAALALTAPISHVAAEAAPADVAKAVYIFCMAAGFLWLMLTAFLGPLFGEFSADHDADVFHLQGDIHLSPMSPSILSAFTASFGCGGLLAMGVWKITSLQALPIALATGGAIAAAVYLLVRHVFMHEQGGVEETGADVIGIQAEVVTSIPANGLGEVSYVTASGRHTSGARTADSSPVALHSVVEIVQVSGPHKVVRLKPPATTARQDGPNQAAPESRA